MEAFIVYFQQECVPKSEETSRSSHYLVWSQFAFKTASVLLETPAHIFGRLLGRMQPPTPPGTRNLHHTSPLSADTPYCTTLQPAFCYNQRFHIHTHLLLFLAAHFCVFHLSWPVSISACGFLESTLPWRPLLSRLLQTSQKHWSKPVVC